MMEECPHCGGEIRDMDTQFSNADYDHFFDTECPHCEKPIEVEVEAVPVFILRKPSEV